MGFRKCASEKCGKCYIDQDENSCPACGCFLSEAIISPETIISMIQQESICRQAIWTKDPGTIKKGLNENSPT